MRIQSSELAFQAAHQRSDRAFERVSIETWRARDSAPRPDTVSLSERAIAASALPAPDSGSSAVSPKLALVKLVLEDLLGFEIEVYDPARDPVDPAADAPAEPALQRPPRRAPTSGAGFELSVLRTREETERLTVTAQGVVRTADGRELQIALGLDLQRSFRETSEVVVRGGTEAPKRKDPLVINLTTQSVAFERERIAFDLDADGVAEQIPNVTSASGFLALDRSGNGRIDDGSELFGARSGNGFAELAQLDDDANGWIDESDAAFTQLRIWRRDAQGGEQVQSLTEAGVGALHLGEARGDFEIRDTDQTPVAEVRSTGLYLHESGQAGSLQQLDFFV